MALLLLFYNFYLLLKEDTLFEKIIRIILYVGITKFPILNFGIIAHNGNDVIPPL